MTLRKLVGMESGVEDLEFEVRPRSLVFENKITPCFTLYLQKGMQVLGRYQSGTKHNTKDSLYRFKHPQLGVFRLRNLNHATYTWNIYRVDQATGTEQFVDYANFDIKRTVELYQIELLEREREIQTSYKEKNVSRAVILEVWNKAKKEMRNNRSMLKCIFQKQAIHLQFQLEIRNSLDTQLLKQDEKKHRRRSKSQMISMGTSLPPLELNGKAKVSEPLIIDDCISPLIRAAKRKHQRQNALLKQKGEAVTHTSIGFPESNAQISEQKGQQRTQKKTNQLQQEDLVCNTVVKVVNPSGRQLPDGEWATNLQKGYTQSVTGVGEAKVVQPIKKFSIMSDIIQQSHEGSSNYGGDKKSSSNGLQKTDAIDTHQAVVGQSKNNVESPLNKFRTLPYDNYEQGAVAKSHLKADLRRAHTAGKDPLEDNEAASIQDSYQHSEIKSSGEKVQKATVTHSGDTNAKYIILIAILIILGLVGKEWFGKCKGPNCKKPKKHRGKY